MTKINTQQMQTQSEIAARLLKAMANAQRLRILCLLIEGAHTVGEINSSIPVSQSALSQHLAVLRKQGLVQTKRKSQAIYYSMPHGPAFQMVEALHRIFCVSEPGLSTNNGVAPKKPFKKEKKR